MLSRRFQKHMQLTAIKWHLSVTDDTAVSQWENFTYYTLNQPVAEIQSILFEAHKS